MHKCSGGQLCPPVLYQKRKQRDGDVLEERKEPGDEQIQDLNSLPPGKRERAVGEGVEKGRWEKMQGVAGRYLLQEFSAKECKDVTGRVDDSAQPLPSACPPTPSSVSAKTLPQTPLDSFIPKILALPTQAVASGRSTAAPGRGHPAPDGAERVLTPQQPSPTCPGDLTPQAWSVVLLPAPLSISGHAHINPNPGKHRSSEKSFSFPPCSSFLPLLLARPVWKRNG